MGRKDKKYRMVREDFNRKIYNLNCVRDNSERKAASEKTGKEAE